MTTSSSTVRSSTDSQPAPPARVPHRWRNLFTLTGATVVDSTEGGMLSTLFPSIAASLALDSSHLGRLSAVAKLASAPAGPAWAWLAGRTSRKFVLVTTSVLGGVFGIAAGFADGYLQLLVLNTLMSASIIGGAPIANAVIMDSFEDRRRAQATAFFYGIVNATGNLLGPVLALYTRSPDGWRYGLVTMGAICIVAGVAQAVFFKDPGVGASDSTPTEPTGGRVRRAQNLRASLALFRIRSYTIMMISRLMSGHLLFMVFGVQFLVTDRGFDNATSAIVLVPAGVGYLVGIFGSGWALPIIDDRFPAVGRVAFLQAAQVVFAVVAFFGTQFGYTSIVVYGVFWFLMSVAQGMNAPVNRPIIASVVLPEARGQAFAIFITVFETLGWAFFTFVGGELAVAIGMQGAFLWFLVVLMLVNAAFLSLLYRTYPRDARRVHEILAARREATDA